jgi:Bacterial type II and III secretion system protein
VRYATEWFSTDPTPHQPAAKAGEPVPKPAAAAPSPNPAEPAAKATEPSTKPLEAQPAESGISPQKPGVVIPSAFETRNAGDTIEVEPVVLPSGDAINLNIVPQIVRLAGEREIKGTVRQPTFETQKFTTSACVKDGHPLLLGTLNPPWQNGIVAEQPQHRIWLDFLTCQVLSKDGSPLHTQKP